MAKQEMNVELLEKVKMKLKRMRHPKHFVMGDWLKNTSCGTAACIAGHGLLLEGYTPNQIDELVNKSEYDEYTRSGSKIEVVARKAFGLTYEQGARLFFTGAWPDDLSVPFDEAEETEDHERMLHLAIQRLDRFIATNGAE